MDVSLALLCDSANITSDGKLNILGQFDTISAATFPTVLPLMHLALRFSAVPADAAEERSLAVRLVNADDHPIGQVSGLLSIPECSGIGELLALQTIVPLPNVTLPEPGRYALEVLIDGDRKRSIGLDVTYSGDLKEEEDGS